MVRAVMAAVALAMVCTAPVAAKPLPKSMKVTLKKGKPYLATDGVSVQLASEWDAWTDIEATLADDGSALLLRYARCGMEIDSEEEPWALPMAVVTAKLENAKGMGLHRKKKYADAAKLFEQATKRDPAVPVYATNWLSALVMGGEVERANTLLEGGLGKAHVAWFAWRLAVDPELAKLRTQPGANKFAAAKPSSLTVKKLGVAVSPLGTAAVGTSDSYGREFVSFVDLATGRETLRLPTKGKVVGGLLQTMGFANTKAKLYWDEGAPLVELGDKYMIDARAAADLGKHIVYIERVGGCDVSEFDFHAAAVTKK